MNKDELGSEADSKGGDVFTDLVVGMHKGQIEAMVYLARHVGLRAGVRPNTAPPVSSVEINGAYLPVSRGVCRVWIQLWPRMSQKGSCQHKMA